ncbi:MAG: YbaK/EbsC family protein [Armatimonadota bacterium]|nr:YbaK/EbsC family protein [Armatimonadota bacterium]MDR7439001.1 YbaK/EbsC family protein [Armatimonadota bacterium]MDR7563259.1 YbaK/EbsC family protein [Armatimonadota bacterium]MDR7566983.1 YbaK/EbsC family protein [Armatimonadota bacterium]MDR7602046.1 YbaK/EbsC family protein [Armatimonadota bacterium]
MLCRERLQRMLEEAGVSYQVMTHPVAYTAQEVAAQLHVSGYQVAKVVMAKVDDRLVMLVLPAPHRVDLERLRRELGATSTRIAHEEEFADVFPDCEVGAMPPFGHLYGIPVYVDRSLTRDPEIVFNAGTHRETIRMRYEDYERLVQPQVLDFAVGP